MQDRPFQGGDIPEFSQMLDHDGTQSETLSGAIAYI